LFCVTVYFFVGWLFIYNCNSAFELNDSVSPARIHRMTKKYQYHVEKQCFRNDTDIGVRSETSGTRDMARAFSEALRYGARVVEGVSGKSRKPYRATGRVMMPSMTAREHLCQYRRGMWVGRNLLNSHLHPLIPLNPSILPWIPV
jgi:hypothetical protein